MAADTLTYAQIEALWIKNGGDPKWAPLMAGIAIAESGGHTTSLNNTPATGDYSVGLWQINYYQGLLPGRTARYGSPATLLASPDAQAKAAVDLFGGGGGLGNWQGDAAWKAWNAHGKPSAPSSADVVGWGYGGVNPTGLSGQALQAAGDAAGTVAGIAVNPVGAITSGAGSGILSFFGVPSINWSIIGAFAMAIGFVIAGIYIMFHSQINDMAKTAIKSSGEAAA